MINMSEHGQIRYSAARWVASVALLLTASCADLLNQGPQAESPGVLLAGLERACIGTWSDINQCLAWSRDGSTLFVVLPRDRDTVLIAVNASAAATGSGASAYRVIGNIGSPISIATAEASTGVYFTRRSTVEVGGYEVRRISLASGDTTRVTNAFAADIAVTPDGTGVAYHAYRGSLTVDSIAIIDVASGTRRAATVGGATAVGVFSPDGKDLAMKAVAGDSSVIWHSTTGIRETPRESSALGGAPRGGGIGLTSRGFATLFSSSTNGGAIETAVATGEAITYAPRDATFRGSYAWSPASSRLFIADGGTCESRGNCSTTTHTYLVVSSPGGVRVIGSVNAGGVIHNFRYFSASPDGRWLAYSAGYGQLYLLPAGF